MQDSKAHLSFIFKTPAKPSQRAWSTVRKRMSSQKLTFLASVWNSAALNTSVTLLTQCPEWTCREPSEGKLKLEASPCLSLKPVPPTAGKIKWQTCQQSITTFQVFLHLAAMWPRVQGGATREQSNRHNWMSWSFTTYPDPSIHELQILQFQQLHVTTIAEWWFILVLIRTINLVNIRQVKHQIQSQNSKRAETD